MTNVYSVAEGNIVDLANVEDEVFSQKMLGDGFGIITNHREIYSPICGKVSMVYDTGHAIGIESDDGQEILVHIGIDTVSLNGEPFETKVSSGDQVDSDTVISIVDWSFIKEKGFDGTVLVIALNQKMNHHLDTGAVPKGALIATIDQQARLE